MNIPLARIVDYRKYLPPGHHTIDHWSVSPVGDGVSWMVNGTALPMPSTAQKYQKMVLQNSKRKATLFEISRNRIPTEKRNLKNNLDWAKQELDVGPNPSQEAIDMCKQYTDDVLLEHSRSLKETARIACEKDFVARAKRAGVDVNDFQSLKQHFSDLPMVTKETLVQEFTIKYIPSIKNERAHFEMEYCMNHMGGVQYKALADGKQKVTKEGEKGPHTGGYIGEYYSSQRKELIKSFRCDRNNHVSVMDRKKPEPKGEGKVAAKRSRHRKCAASASFDIYDVCYFDKTPFREVYKDTDLCKLVRREYPCLIEITEAPKSEHFATSQQTIPIWNARSPVVPWKERSPLGIDIPIASFPNASSSVFAQDAIVPAATVMPPDDTTADGDALVKTLMAQNAALKKQLADLTKKLQSETSEKTSELLSLALQQPQQSQATIEEKQNKTKKESHDAHIADARRRNPEKMNVSDLKNYCKEHNVKKYSTKTKKELVAIVTEHMSAERNKAGTEAQGKPQAQGAFRAVTDAMDSAAASKAKADQPKGQGVSQAVAAAKGSVVSKAKGKPQAKGAPSPKDIDAKQQALKDAGEALMKEIRETDLKNSGVEKLLDFLIRVDELYTGKEIYVAKNREEMLEKCTQEFLLNELEEWMTPYFLGNDQKKWRIKSGYHRVHQVTGEYQFLVYKAGRPKRSEHCSAARIFADLPHAVLDYCKVTREAAAPLVEAIEAYFSPPELKEMKADEMHCFEMLKMIRDDYRCKQGPTAVSTFDDDDDDQLMELVSKSSSGKGETDFKQDDLYPIIVSPPPSNPGVSEEENEVIEGMLDLLREDQTIGDAENNNGDGSIVSTSCVFTPVPSPTRMGNLAVPDSNLMESETVTPKQESRDAGVKEEIDAQQAEVGPTGSPETTTAAFGRDHKGLMPETQDQKNDAADSAMVTSAKDNDWLCTKEHHNAVNASLTSSTERGYTKRWDYFLWDRKCNDCNKKFVDSKTTPHSTTEIVVGIGKEGRVYYCEACYDRWNDGWKKTGCLGKRPDMFFLCDTCFNARNLKCATSVTSPRRKRQCRTDAAEKDSSACKRLKF